MVIMRYVRAIAGGGILLFQIAMIGYARFVPSRYFCWAPYDIQSAYRLDVSIGGRALTPAQIRSRYRPPKQGVDNRSIQHVMGIVEQYEPTYGSADHSRAVLKNGLNRKEEPERP